MVAKPLLFISHKHENRNIADAIRSCIEANTGGMVEVFQSSSEHSPGPRAGYALNQELKSALWRARAFVLVYTHSNLDWSYCMFEYGVANNPNSPDTKIVLFKCCNAEPPLFSGQVYVNARKLGDIQKFINQLLTAHDFFPDHGGPITQHLPNSQMVATIAADFYQKLQPVLPTTASHEEWPAFPYLQLELSATHVNSINTAATHEDRSKIASQLIRNESIVVDFDKGAERLFNFPSFQKEMKFETLVKAWSEKSAKSDTHSRWVESLCKQITEAARWQFPPVIWELMQGIDDDDWYAPILVRVRRMPQQSMQFDVYFFRFELDTAKQCAKVEIPRS
jgi:hypothetical protein